MRRSVYIGTEGGQELAAAVLKFTIERRSAGTVAVRFLNRELAASGMAVENTVNSNTPFSKQRLFVPRLAGSGQAAYLDSDMLVFRNINELFEQVGEHAIASCRTRQSGREPQTSVTIFDVARCDWDPQAIVGEIDADPAKYRPYLYEFAFAGGTARVLPAAWNDLEEFESATTCLLHYTDMDTQPWLTSTNRLADVWLDCLSQAVVAGAVDVAAIDAQVQSFHVRPSLAWQARHGWARSSEIPFAQRVRDVWLYVPPQALANGLPFGLGWRIGRLLASRAPRVLKSIIVCGCAFVLLARRRRRLLVKATLANRRCVINAKTAAVLT